MKSKFLPLSLLGLMLGLVSFATSIISSSGQRSRNGVCIKPDGSGSSSDDFGRLEPTCTAIGAGQECDVTLAGTAISDVDTDTIETTISAAGGIDGTGCQK